MSLISMRVKNLDNFAACVAFSLFFVGGFLAGAPQFGHDLRSHGVGLPQSLIPQRLIAPGLIPSGELTGVLWPFSGNAARGIAASASLHWPDRSVVTVAVSDTEGLVREFDHMRYQLDDNQDGGMPVPRVLVSTLPPDLTDLNDVDRHKSLFFQVMLPLVLQANELILDQRQRIQTIAGEVAAGKTLSADERKWLDDVKSYYDVESDDFAVLLRHVDVVPVSLALAQAAIESGWGTSRFAVEGNALFGQYTTTAPSLMPVALTGGDVRIHTFGGLFEAVSSYMRNLNTHPAYESFRALRASERSLADDLDPIALAGELTRYSARGDDYVRDVRRTIRGNLLGEFDNAWLIDGKITRIVFGNI
jgi:Bax protein